MQRIRVSQLKVGDVFSQPMFTDGGQKLLAAGQTLTRTQLDVISRAAGLAVVLADNMADLARQGIVKPVDPHDLQVGRFKRSPLVSSSGRVIVEPNQKIEPHHLDALAADTQGPFVAPAVPTRDRERERRHRGDVLAEQLVRQGLKLPRRVEPMKSRGSWFKRKDAHQWPGIHALAAQRLSEIETIRAVYARIEAGVDPSLFELSDMVFRLATDLTHFPSQFTQLALLCPQQQDYLPDHAYTVAVLAMAIGAHLRWPLQDVKHVGLAGLIFDVGMLLVPAKVRATFNLSKDDLERVHRHPADTLALLHELDAVDVGIRLAALQHHEREDGRGYPAGARAHAICDYARVLAVADSFAAACEPRHYRAPKLPYTAMEEVLRGAAQGALWCPAARALVQAAGLFPVGSYVELSTGVLAHVLAVNPRTPDRPTVQPLTRSGNPRGEAINLAATLYFDVKIVRPVESPARRRNEAA